MKKTVIYFAILLFLSCSDTKTRNEYYTDRKIKEMTEYQNGKKNGKCKSFSPNGILITLSEWKDDLKNGKEIQYDSIGKIKASCTFLNGQETGKYVIYHDSDFSDKYYVITEGEKINGEVMEAYIKYFTKKDSLLHKEIYQKKIDSSLEINDERCYTLNGKLDTSASCFFSIKSQDTVFLHDTLKMLIESECFDFDNVGILIGDYDEHYRIVGNNIDTLESKTNFINYLYVPKKQVKLRYVAF